MTARRGPRCKARHGISGERCARIQNHVGQCWSEWVVGGYARRWRLKWYRHGMKWTF